MPDRTPEPMVRFGRPRAEGSFHARTPRIFRTPKKRQTAPGAHRPRCGGRPRHDAGRTRSAPSKRCTETRYEPRVRA
jgi:hypothetical protein